MTTETIKTENSTFKLNSFQLLALVILRIAIGWHLLYEGIIKLLTPDWSAASYLELSRWLFADFFRAIAANSTLLTIVNYLNIYGLILIGLGLILGCLTRLASIAGALLLLLYYVANPPFMASGLGIPAEGHYLIIDKTLIEAVTLIILAIIPTGKFLGLDAFIFRKRLKSREQLVAPAENKIESDAPQSIPDFSTGRRELLKGLATVPFLGAFTVALVKKQGWMSYEEKNLKDAVTSATIKSFNFAGLKDLKATPPLAPIGDKKFSRMILGGNLIGGWAHARDLIYVSKLVKAYHHKTKIFETLLLAEKCGINAILTNPILAQVINEYWKQNIGKIQFISDCGGDDLLERVQVSIDSGAAACYVQGGVADQLVQDGKIELISKAVDLIRKNNLPAGIGAHFIETITACVDFGLKPDFWVKTLHHRNYWSANTPTENDNIYCRKPEATIEFMKTQTIPWIAFKTLAAGAIPPKEGFQYAFENGADFICVGMYDFQIVEDVNLVMEILNSKIDRQRLWYA
ncbi:DoxX family membrane protein [candidate division KSB1 bacterium]|nr:DoxX family membrane protein [candidate division KSB1 bacterium]